MCRSVSLGCPGPASDFFLGGSLYDKCFEVLGTSFVPPLLQTSIGLSSTQSESGSGSTRASGYQFTPSVPARSFAAYFRGPSCPIVAFHFKTDGCRIWGVLRNLSTIPQHLSPRFDLIACRTTTAFYFTPDTGPAAIPSTRRGMLWPSQHHQLTTVTSASFVPHWLLACRCDFPLLFKLGLGRCAHHSLSSLPFKFPLPLK